MSNNLLKKNAAPSHSLVGRMMRAYFLWAVVSYVVNLAGLWWSAHYVVEANLKKQANHLITEFDEMGAPLFFSDSSSALERMRKYAGNDENVLFVRYYRSSDNKILGQYVKSGKVMVPKLMPEQIAEMQRSDMSTPITVITHQLGIVNTMHAMAPVRAHSMSDESMLDMRGLDDRRTERTVTIGYLDVGMDISPSRAVVFQGVFVVAGLLTLALLVALYLVRNHVRRSLASLLQLQEPLKQVAAGNFNAVVWHNARDSEIALVCDAVNATIGALRQRDAEKEEALRAKLDAEAASQLKSLFLAHMSHEIRTPLNGVMGFLKLLSKTRLTAVQRDYLHTIEVSATTLLTVINDILDFSKIEADKISIESIDIELRELLDDVMSLHAASAEEKGLDLVLIFSKDVPVRLLGDPARITQVVSNLVGNAIKFTQHGEVLVQVNLLEKTEKDVLVDISIKDSGIGISAEAQERLFQPFSQADASTTRNYGGTGLGLIISKRLVEMMGGEIKLESQPGQGASFSFTLSLPRQTEACDYLPLGKMLAGKRILTVTPNERTAKSLSESLESWGISSDSISSEQFALKALEAASTRESAYAAVIFDKADKDMTLRTFSKHIKRIGDFHEIPMLLLAGLSTCIRSQEVRANGFAGCVSKPVKNAELYSELAKIFVCTSQYSAEYSGQSLRLQSRETSMKLHALIVDDNEINRKLERLLIEQLGGAVDEAENGLQAVEICKRKIFDLILMDVHMPVMDGMDATTLIREMETGAHRTLIIALTANALSGDREHYLEVGMDEYLSKPLNDKVLLNTLKHLGLTVDASIPDSSLEEKLPDSHITNNITDDAAVADHDELPILDPGMGVKLAFGDRETWHIVLGMLFDQLADTAGKLRAEKLSWNPESLRKVAHGLAGASSYCGVPALHHGAKKVEEFAKKEDMDKALQALDVLLHQIERLLTLKKDGMLPDGESPIY